MILVELREVVPYAEVYGIHPSQFVVDAHGGKVPMSNRVPEPTGSLRLLGARAHVKSCDAGADGLGMHPARGGARGPTPVCSISFIDRSVVQLGLHRWHSATGLAQVV